MCTAIQQYMNKNDECSYPKLFWYLYTADVGSVKVCLYFNALNKEEFKEMEE